MQRSLEEAKNLYHHKPQPLKQPGQASASDGDGDDVDEDDGSSIHSVSAATVPGTVERQDDDARLKKTGGAHTDDELDFESEKVPKAFAKQENEKPKPAKEQDS